MPSEIYMSINDPDGNLTEDCCGKESIGSFFKSDHDEESLILAYNHKVSVPTNTLTGQVTGTRKHEYLEVTKFIDKSSPLLVNAVTAPTDLEVVLRFFRTPDETSAGEPVEYYNITLNRAKIVSIETISPNILMPENDGYVPYELVRFTYGQIQCDHVVCGTTAIDDWSGEGE
ncbi:type VI secretion system tube protein Hcp [Pseudomonadales bacterium]|nr:type VI secretion system tube protein Hcp [Pseudomonadales bacterium]HAQ58433.1 type VI secretion system tube protein Hcp [Opitutae bacterium]MDA9366128.1 type VI secretion system tube protein Hcp [Pseudomonadales bacterium]MDB4069064.1 type VI secretion system tube protein Hcp [Pseudomonadales bacterium]MDB9867764.1 type VI secretion system tube protein Hcp [Pseudomonadales bacterium]|tara:strand:- start:3217 stop:3735 length:519 start_codon:yes stop_codon:yes gene_type:complete